MYLVDNMEERKARCFENRNNNIQNVELNCELLFCFGCTKAFSDDTV